MWRSDVHKKKRNELSKIELSLLFFNNDILVLIVKLFIMRRQLKQLVMVNKSTNINFSNNCLSPPIIKITTTYFRGFLLFTYRFNTTKGPTI